MGKAGARGAVRKGREDGGAAGTVGELWHRVALPRKKLFQGASAPGVGAGVSSGRRVAGPGAAAEKRTEGPAGMLPRVLP